MPEAFLASPPGPTPSASSQLIKSFQPQQRQFTELPDCRQQSAKKSANFSFF